MECGPPAGCGSSGNRPCLLSLVLLSSCWVASGSTHRGHCLFHNAVFACSSASGRLCAACVPRCSCFSVSIQQLLSLDWHRRRGAVRCISYAPRGAFVGAGPRVTHAAGYCASCVRGDGAGPSFRARVVASPGLFPLSTFARVFCFVLLMICVARAGLTSHNAR